MKNNICSELLETWAERLLSLQLTSIREDGLYGGIMCPACSMIHGRCVEAVYPFLYMADVHRDPRYLTAAKLLFDWAEHTVSRPDGSYVNDVNCDWKGTTVFTAIQFAEALHFHGHILDDTTRTRWTDRLKKAAEFLYDFDGITDNNINYRITNVLAMYYFGELLKDDRYTARAKEESHQVLSYLSDDFLLFGEGRPNNGQTQRGCRAVDIGYNVEESLPSLAAYAKFTDDRALTRAVSKALESHLMFMLPDGGWDNSFGTRNFKWTYWGSRTSDGCAFGYLLLAQAHPSFAYGAALNLNLLKDCTYDGLLHGGPHNHHIGVRACVHHTFAHAKVLVNILNHSLEVPVLSDREFLPRQGKKDILYYPDTDSLLVNRDGMLATITANDWEYLPGGHASGGAISLLWHPNTGPVLCASMSQYQPKEPNNMQLPPFGLHDCLTPALELREKGKRYSTLYDFQCGITYESTDRETRVTVTGSLLDLDHQKPDSPCRHTTNYFFSPDKVTIAISLDNRDARYLCPLISGNGEPVYHKNNRLLIEKGDHLVCMQVQKGKLELPNGLSRCYNLVPGLQAVKTEIIPENTEIQFSIGILQRKDCLI